MNGIQELPGGASSHINTSDKETQEPGVRLCELKVGANSVSEEH